MIRWKWMKLLLKGGRDICPPARRQKLIIYGGLAWDDYERMAAFSRANRLRLENALETLRMKRNIAEVDGNWEEASNYGRAMAEIESLMDIA